MTKHVIVIENDGEVEVLRHNFADDRNFVAVGKAAVSDVQRLVDHANRLTAESTSASLGDVVQGLDNDI